MEKTATVWFDGEMIRPEGPIDMEPNKRYNIRYESEHEKQSNGSFWDLLEEIAGTVEAPPDWSEEHDHYIHGAPRRNAEDKS